MILLEMRGRLTPLKVDEEMNVFLREINLAGREGNNFVVMEKPDGSPTGFALHNLLTFEEVDDESDILG